MNTRPRALTMLLAAVPLVALAAGGSGTNTASATSPAGGFIKRFTMLGGKIDKELWPPLTATDYGPYVSAIPKTTQAVFAATPGSGAIDFTKAYAQFGLHGKIPLYGNTTMFDYSVLPGEVPADVLGDQMAAQYCDGINTPANNTFTSLFKKAYHVFPGSTGRPPA